MQTIDFGCCIKPYNGKNEGDRAWAHEWSLTTLALTTYTDAGIVVRVDTAYECDNAAGVYECGEPRGFMISLTKSILSGRHRVSMPMCVGYVMHDQIARHVEQYRESQDSSIGYSIEVHVGVCSYSPIKTYGQLYFGQKTRKGPVYLTRIEIPLSHWHLDCIIQSLENVHFGMDNRMVDSLKRLHNKV